MFGKLHLFLTKSKGERLEITTKHIEGAAENGFTFTGVSYCIEEADDDLGWVFKDVENWKYSALCFKDIARVRRVGETEYAYIAEDELAVAS